MVVRTDNSPGLALLFSLLVGLLSVCHAVGQETNSTLPTRLDWSTVAERSNYRETATGGEVEQLLRQLANRWSTSEMISVGQTVEGRTIWGLVVNPTKETTQRPLTILVLGGIHSGECDGKEAILALARDLALSDSKGNWWQELRLIFVPNFNADGNERRSPNHRPGQVGPVGGMGVRENAQGLDLNRDFIKLESPEVKSLTAALNEFDVDVLIDTHTTNGSLHRYLLTYDIPHCPATPAAIDQWLRGSLLPKVSQRLTEFGIDTFYYGNFNAEHTRWSTYGHEPRYSTEIMGLRGRIGILAESYSYADYQTRIRATYGFVEQVLKEFAAQSDEVRQLISQSATTRSNTVPLNGVLSKTDGKLAVAGYRGSGGEVPQGPFDASSSAKFLPHSYEVELWNKAVATRSTPIAAYYTIPKQYAWAASRLQRHGVEVQQLTKGLKLTAEQLRIAKVTRSNSEFQGHRLLSLEVESRTTVSEFPTGTFVVSTSQPLGLLAAYLVEPESEDGLAAWGFFEPDVAENVNFPVCRVRAEIDATALVPVTSVSASEQITLEHLASARHLVDYNLELKREAQWLGNSDETIVNLNGNYMAVDALTGAQRQVGELNDFRRALAELDEFSESEARELASPQNMSVDFKRGLVLHKNDLFLWDAAQARANRLTSTPMVAEKLAELSPDGTRIAFVVDNDLWLIDCRSGQATRLTQDGSDDRLNGILDWVYQEELYGRGRFKAFWWSPDSQQIAYLSLDQSPVPKYQVADSSSVRQSLEETRYPNAGDPLPTVQVGLVDVSDPKPRLISLDAFPEDDRLIARVTWSPQGDLWLVILNRVQTKLNLVRVTTKSLETHVLFEEVSPGWIEIRSEAVFLDNGDLLWLSDLPSGRTHLFRVSAETGIRKQLTQGEWDVSAIVSVKSDFSTAYVTGNISHPTETQLIAVNLANGEQRAVTNAPGSGTYKFSASGNYFLESFSNAHSPKVSTLRSTTGDQIRVVEAPVSDRHEFLDILPPQRITIKARDGLDMQAMILLPKDYVPKADSGKLPVIFHVYGGPQAPTVKNTWGGRFTWWHQFLCQNGYAVVLCDNRAALGRGVRDTWEIRKNLGRVELLDLEDAAAWVAQQPWADTKRFGLWGWSYGGYFTAYAMTHSTTFRAGIAGAPVTDWRNYDAIYTERYMDLPERNGSGYQSSSVVEAAQHLSGRLLLIHGDQDDNVHLSNTLQLANALQQHGKQFDLMIYPGNRHSITKDSQRFHLHQLMLDFWQTHLPPTQSSN